jgi:hypothetical protein
LINIVQDQAIPQTIKEDLIELNKLKKNQPVVFSFDLNRICHHGSTNLKFLNPLFDPITGLYSPYRYIGYFSEHLRKLLTKQVNSIKYKEILLELQSKLGYNSPSLEELVQDNRKDSQLMGDVQDIKKHWGKFKQLLTRIIIILFTNYYHFCISVLGSYVEFVSLIMDGLSNDQNHYCFELYHEIIEASNAAAQQILKKYNVPNVSILFIKLIHCWTCLAKCESITQNEEEFNSEVRVLINTALEDLLTTDIVDLPLQTSVWPKSNLYDRVIESLFHDQHEPLDTILMSKKELKKRIGGIHDEMITAAAKQQDQLLNIKSPSEMEECFLDQLTQLKLSPGGRSENSNYFDEFVSKVDSDVYTWFCFSLSQSHIQSQMLQIAMKSEIKESRLAATPVINKTNLPGLDPGLFNNNNNKSSPSFCSCQFDRTGALKCSNCGGNNPLGYSNEDFDIINNNNNNTTYYDDEHVPFPKGIPPIPQFKPPPKLAPAENISPQNSIRKPAKNLLSPASYKPKSSNNSTITKCFATQPSVEYNYSSIDLGLYAEKTQDNRYTQMKVPILPCFMVQALEENLIELSVHDTVCFVQDFSTFRRNYCKKLFNLKLNSTKEFMFKEDFKERNQYCLEPLPLDSIQETQIFNRLLSNRQFLGINTKEKFYQQLEKMSELPKQVEYNPGDVIRYQIPTTQLTIVNQSMEQKTLVFSNNESPDVKSNNLNNVIQLNSDSSAIQLTNNSDNTRDALSESGQKEEKASSTEIMKVDWENKYSADSTDNNKLGKHSLENSNNNSTETESNKKSRTESDSDSPVKSTELSLINSMNNNNNFNVPSNINNNVSSSNNSNNIFNINENKSLVNEIIKNNGININSLKIMQLSQNTFQSNTLTVNNKSMEMILTKNIQQSVSASYTSNPRVNESSVLKVFNRKVVKSDDPKITQYLAEKKLRLYSMEHQEVQIRQGKPSVKAAIIAVVFKNGVLPLLKQQNLESFIDEKILLLPIMNQSEFLKLFKTQVSNSKFASFNAQAMNNHCRTLFSNYKENPQSFSYDSISVLVSPDDSGTFHWRIKAFGVESNGVWKDIYVMKPTDSALFNSKQIHENIYFRELKPEYRPTSTELDDAAEIYNAIFQFYIGALCSNLDIITIPKAFNNNPPQQRLIANTLD